LGNKMRDWCDAAGLPQCSAPTGRDGAADNKGRPQMLNDTNVERVRSLNDSFRHFADWAVADIR
jgi:hypothetical protein